VLADFLSCPKTVGKAAVSQPGNWLTTWLTSRPERGFVVSGRGSLALPMSFLFVLFQHRSRCDFLGAPAIASRFLGRFFDVLILALFLGANAS